MANSLSILFFITESFSEIPEKVRQFLKEKEVDLNYFNVVKEQLTFRKILKATFPDVVIVCSSEEEIADLMGEGLDVPMVWITDHKGNNDHLFDEQFSWVKKVDPGRLHELYDLLLLLKAVKSRNYRNDGDNMDQGLAMKIFNSAQELIVVTQGDQLKFFNSRVKEYYNVTDEDLLKTRFWDFIYPDDWELLKRERGKRLKGENDEAFYQFRGKDRNGKITWFRINGFRIFWEGEPATLNFLVPINEQKKAEEENRKTQQFLDDILEFSPEGIIILDSDLKIFRVNRSIIQILRIEKANLEGKVLKEITPFRHSKLIEEMHLDIPGDDYNGLTKEITFSSDKGKSLVYIVQRTNHMMDRSIILWFRDVSDEKKKENEILERELKYRTILEYSPVPLFSHDYTGVKETMNEIHKQGVTNMRSYLEKNREVVENMLKKIKMLDCNNETLKYFRVANPKELQQSLTKTIHDDLVPVFINVAVAFWEGNTVFEMEIDSRLPDRKFNAMVKWILVPGHEITWDMILTSITDTSERQKYEKQLKVLSSAVDHSPASVVITDVHGEIEYVNPKFTEVTGYTVQEAIGKNPRILKSGNLPASLYENLWKTITQGKEWRGEFENRKKSGELFWELASISGIKNEKGEIVYYVAIKEDITERKKTEIELLKAKEKAEESDRLKTAFLANMSHEIRTPLNAIIGFSDILRSTHLDEQQREEYFSIINFSSQTLLKLIDDIIDVAKIEADHIRIIPHQFDLTELLNELYVTYQREIRLNNEEVELRLSLPVKQSFLFVADAIRLKQVLSNLLGNAIKFTSKGIIEFGYTFPSDKMIEFYVRDSGIGIPEDKRKVIFNRFRQVDDSTTREFGGTGLGLWISKNLVTLMGGTIWVESKEGAGSTFYFTFTLDEGSVIPKNPGRLPKEEEQFTTDWSGKQILIAEDNDSNFEYLKAVLSVKKAMVIRAVNGKEVLDRLNDHQDIDLILMDIHMPVLNGYEATRIIKKMHPELPVVAQTAFAMSEDRKKVIDAGCDEYIAKPIPSRKLIGILKKYLNDPMD